MARDCKRKLTECFSLKAQEKVGEQEEELELAGKLICKLCIQNIKVENITMLFVLESGQDGCDFVFPFYENKASYWLYYK